MSVSTCAVSSPYAFWRLLSSFSRVRVGLRERLLERAHEMLDLVPPLVVAPLGLRAELAEARLDVSVESGPETLRQVEVGAVELGRVG